MRTSNLPTCHEACTLFFPDSRPPVCSQYDTPRMSCLAGTLLGQLGQQMGERAVDASETRGTEATVSALEVGSAPAPSNVLPAGVLVDMGHQSVAELGGWGDDEVCAALQAVCLATNKATANQHAQHAIPIELQRSSFFYTVTGHTFKAVLTFFPPSHHYHTQLLVGLDDLHLHALYMRELPAHNNTVVVTLL